MRLFKKKTPPPARNTSTDLLIEAKLLAQQTSISSLDAHKIMRLSRESGRLEIIEALRAHIEVPIRFRGFHS